jgi:hypothetical protein
MSLLLVHTRIVICRASASAYANLIVENWSGGGTKARRVGKRNIVTKQYT